MVKHRKKSAVPPSSRQEDISSSTSSSMNMSSTTSSSLLPRSGADCHGDDDTNGKGRKTRPRTAMCPPSSPSSSLHFVRAVDNFLHRLRRVLSIATGNTVTLLATILTLSCLLLSLLSSQDHDDQNHRVDHSPWPAWLPPSLGTWSAAHLFVVRPLLTVLSVVIGPQGKVVDRTERLVAAAFLLAVLGGQCSKAGNAAAASAAVCAFGLASRRLAESEGVGVGVDGKANVGVGVGKDGNHYWDGDDDDIHSSEPPPSSSTATISSHPLQRLWSDSTLRTRATLSTLAVVASLLFENFLIWVVSATYRPGIDGSPEPLQDNGRWALEALARALVAAMPGWGIGGGTKQTEMDRDLLDDNIKKALQRLRRGLNVQWALVAGFAASLVCLELKLGRYQDEMGGDYDSYYHYHQYCLQPQQHKQLEHRQSTQPQPTQQPHPHPHPPSSTQPTTTTPPPTHQPPYRPPRTLAGLALRSLLTLSSARLIRTLSFTLTVLPSQIPRCYPRRFPHPPPTDWPTWLQIGFLPNSRGGCNDLILSGHATVTSTLACGLTSVAGNGTFARAVWTLVAVDYAIEALEGLHYSVDMWLGCVVTCLLWVLTRGAEREGDRERNELRREWTKRQQRLQLYEYSSRTPTWNGTVIGMYALPAVLGFFVLTVVPEAYVNYFLVGYTLWAGGIVFRWGQTNYSQHILLCLLYVTLAAYL